MKLVHRYQLKLSGIYNEKEIGIIPEVPGLYCVYQVNENNDRCLLYIGESDNVNKRISKKHEKRKEWELYLNEADTIEYAIIEHDNFSSEKERRYVENAMIFCYKPPVNTEGIKSFNYDSCVIISFEGKLPNKFYSEITVCGKSINI